MKKLNVLLAAVFFSFAVTTFVSCNSPASVKMQLLSDGITVIVKDDDAKKFDTSDVVVLYMSKYRTNGEWQLASNSGGLAYSIEGFTKDTTVSYTNGNNEECKEYYRLAKIIKGKEKK